MKYQDIIDQLNPEQKEAVCSANRHSLVLAGAGTGKTSTLVARAAHFIANGTAAHRIQILSFTRKASKDVESKILHTLGDSAKGCKVSTFHSWCSILIRQNTSIFGALDYSVIDRDDQLQVFKVCRQEVDDNDFPTAAQILEVFSFAQNTGKNLSESIAIKLPDKKSFHSQLASVCKAYQEEKKKSRYLDYDDILKLVAETLNESQKVAKLIAEKYECILVDEMQDTNPLQWKVLSPLKDFTKLFCVGDDAQSIYAFRGADFENIHSFTNRVPDSVVHKLCLNYRSTQEILDVGNWLLRKSSLRYDKELRANRGHGTKPKLVSFQEVMDQSEWIGEDLSKRYQKDGKWAKYMILVRSQAAGRLVEQVLIKRAIPYRYFGGTRFLDLKHIKDFLTVARILGNPLDLISWTRYLQLFSGVGPVAARKSFEAIAKGRNWEERFRIMASQSKLPSQSLKTLEVAVVHQADVPLAMQKAFAVIEETLKRNFGEQNWNQRKEDFTHLFDLAKNSNSFPEFIEDYILAPVFQSEVRAGQISDCITLSTIHSAKGLECDTVYVFDVSAGVFPNFHQAKTLNDIEEERRVLYVALTRAMYEMIITRSTVPRMYPGQNDIVRNEELYFFKDIPLSLFETETHVSHSAQRESGSGRQGFTVDLGIDLS